MLANNAADTYLAKLRLLTQQHKQISTNSRLTPVVGRARVLADEVQVSENAQKPEHLALVSVHKLGIEVEVFPDLVDFSASQRDVVDRGIVVDGVINDRVEELWGVVAFDVICNQTEKYSVI